MFPHFVKSLTTKLPKRQEGGSKLDDVLATPCCQNVIPEVSNWLFAHFVAETSLGVVKIEWRLGDISWKRLN